MNHNDIRRNENENENGKFSHVRLFQFVSSF